MHCWKTINIKTRIWVQLALTLWHHYFCSCVFFFIYSLWYKLIHYSISDDYVWLFLY